MKVYAQRSRLTCAALLVLVLGLAWASPARADGANVIYTGRAFGAFLNVPTLGVGPVFLADTGELSPDGAPRSRQLLDVTVPGVLSVAVLVAETSGANGEAQSSASVLNVTVLPGHPAQVTASLLQAESRATCNAAMGATHALDVTFGGQQITVDPFAPNQVFVIPDPLGAPPLATLAINEQVQSEGPGSREITVNALHLTLNTGDEVILSSARSDIHGCPGCPPPPPCHDFVTGGGWINVGKSRASFGLSAGFKGGSPPDVSFNYIDHNNGMHMKATSITLYAEGASKTSRRFQGAAEINGVPGFTYRIEVADNGEPGRADTLRIELSNGYSAGGPVAGGNIQLHKPCP